MDFTNVQPVLQIAISAANPMSALNPTNVVVDYGHARPQVESLLDVSTTPPGAGWAIAIWPTSKGSALDNDASGSEAVDSVVVIRVSFNPKFLISQDAAAAADLTGNTPIASTFVNQVLQSIVRAVLGIAPDFGGVHFQLAGDAFELMDIDEGLLAFHLRFKVLTVF